MWYSRDLVPVLSSLLVIFLSISHFRLIFLLNIFSATDFMIFYIQAPESKNYYKF